MTPRTPEIRLGGRTYPASYFVELIDSLTRSHKDRPSTLDFLKQVVVEAARRNQEHNGDSLRGGGSTEGRGKGTHSDPTASAAGTEWPYDEVDGLTERIAGHILELVTHAHAGASNGNRLLSIGNEGRRSSLVECANKNCENTMTGLENDRPRRGRCRRCFTFLQRHDRDWTASQSEEEVA